jgi:LmbE family N-acetylglucosaminyl deacetylase
MKRRNFISKNLLTGAVLPAAYASLGATPAPTEIVRKTDGGFPGQKNEVVIEKVVEGQPHKGKVLAVIQPHSDDIAYFAAGTVAKMIYEGYTGYLIRMTNDDAAGGGSSFGERVFNNEKDNEAVAKTLGLKKTYSLNYRNHRMDEYNIQEIKGRLILLLRNLKVDTLVCYDTWGHYEEKTDH